MPTALLLNHRGRRCGVYQFGFRLFTILSPTRDFQWEYVECDSAAEAQAAVSRLKPSVVAFNFVGSTMEWLPQAAKSGFGGAATFGIYHEANQDTASIPKFQVAEGLSLDFWLCPDPTLLEHNPTYRSVPRFIPQPVTELPPLADVFTVGSFGFASANKGFDRVCALVNEQFDNARIRINIPPHDNPATVSEDQFHTTVESCRARITKPGIVLDISREFLDDDQLLQFLSQNTINVFAYDSDKQRGISSCTDYALASMRPFAVSRSTMFRHLHDANPSIILDDRPLAAIAATDTSTLNSYRERFSALHAGEVWSRTICEALKTLAVSRATPDRRGFNKRLDDRSRAAYGRALADLATHAPEMLTRKIERANIQQAFAVDAVERLATRYAGPRILAVGSYEDTSVATLRSKGYRIEEIDPQINGLDLQKYYESSEAIPQSFDLIMSVSVLEHVQADKEFLWMIGDLLAPDGIAILTVDFCKQYTHGDRLPPSDYRLYTERHLLAHIRRMPQCALFDPPSWDDGEDDFEFRGCRYSFATFVFRKFDERGLRFAPPHLASLGHPPWKQALRKTTEDAETLRKAAEEAKIAAAIPMPRPVAPIAPAQAALADRKKKGAVEKIVREVRRFGRKIRQR